MNFISDLPEREMFPGFRGRFIHTENTTLAFWEIDAGAAIPEHNHVHEQIMLVQEGEFELVLEGNSEIYKAGSQLVIPSNAKHYGKAITNCKILDVFTPVREDYR